MRKTFKQIRNVIAFGAIFVAVAYMNHLQWVKLLVVFLTWIMTIQYQALAYYCKNRKWGEPVDDVVKKWGEPVDDVVKILFESYKNGEHFPRWLDNFTYLCVSLFLAAIGHWVLAICWILIGSGDLTVRHYAERDRPTPQTP